MDRRPARFVHGLSEMLTNRMWPENLWVWALAASSRSHAHPTFVPHLFAGALTPKCPTENCSSLAGCHDGPREMLEAATASRETQHSGCLLEGTATTLCLP